MVSALSSGASLANMSSLYSLQNNPADATTSNDGADPTQNAATISGPGQLLSDLQQLQTQNPTKFQQVTATIASQLQSTAGQVQGPQSVFLSNLSQKFQDVSNGGSLSQLQPQGHHHHHRAHQAYSQNSSSDTQNGIAGIAATNSDSSSGTSGIQQLFATISSEVSKALG